MIFDNFFKLSFHWVELKKGKQGLELNQSKEYIHSGVHIQCVKQHDKQHEAMEIKCRTCYIKGRLCVPAKIHQCLEYSDFYLVSAETR